MGEAVMYQPYGDTLYFILSKELNLDVTQQKKLEKFVSKRVFNKWFNEKEILEIVEDMQCVPIKKVKSEIGDVLRALDKIACDTDEGLTIETLKGYLWSRYCIE